MIFLLDHDTPDEIAFSLQALGHKAVHLRDVLSPDTEDAEVFAHAQRQGWVMITCNRDDFLALATSQPHGGLIILIRRRTRVAERAAIIRLLDRAGETGIVNNINFA